MKVVIDKPFEGYPDGGGKPSRHYVASPNEVDVPDEFGAMIVGKGLARAADAAAARPSPALAARDIEQVHHEAQ